MGWHRAAATHLDRRLPAGDLATAAAAGLQDSAPRSALLALHARVDGVVPSSWEDPSLVQIWFRGADYVVPRADVGVFTLGALPRDAEKVAALDALASRFLEVLDGRARPPKEVAQAVPGDENRFLIRAASVTGRFHIRWDASTIVVMPAERPDLEPEDARLELARRFLHCYGPARVDQFAKWANVSRPDARSTWAALAAELVTADVGDGDRWMLAVDRAALDAAVRPQGVRLLPHGDPYLYLDHDQLAPAARRRLPEPGPDVTPRLLNSLSGRLLVDGELAGQWGRVQGKFTIAPWAPLPESTVARVEAEVATEAGPLGVAPVLRWLD